MPLIAGQILRPMSPDDVIVGPHRVLHISIDEGIVWCIPLPRHAPNGRAVGYACGPVALPLNALTTAIENGRLAQTTFEAPARWAMSDAEYRDESLPELVRVRRKNRLDRRDAAWRIIEPIVNGHTLPDLLGSCLLRRLIRARAAACHRSVVTVYRYLHIYWAFGSVRNGLIPMTQRCGAPGMIRHSRKLLGRPSRLSKLDPNAPHQYRLLGKDKRRIGIAYARIHQGTPIGVAYHDMCNMFYSETTVRADGSESVELYPEDRCPSKRHFCYWGKKLAGSDAFRRKNGLPAILIKRCHRGGSTRELADAGGECAQFDATSIDVYLASLYDRRVVLPAATRSIIIEQRSTVILGVNVGWEHASSGTFLQTVYIAATDKVELCARFGIDIGPDDWPGLVCRKYLVDNGEARTSESLTAAAQIGTDIEYAPSYAGAAKGDVESHHHSDHRRLDHLIPGTTHGRQKQRGEKDPADFALWNYYEYMREYLLTCIAYNNTEAPELAPTRMLMEQIRPTRINILKWLLAHDQRADIIVDLNLLRAWTLPIHHAVIQYNGIILKYPGSENNVHGPRFMSEALREDPRFVEAVRLRRTSRVQVRFQQENLRELWLPSDRGLLRIPNVASDDTLLRRGTLADLASYREAEADRSAKLQQTSDQAAAEAVQRHLATTEGAKVELREQMTASPDRISRAKRRASLRTNAATEQQIISSPHFGHAPPELANLKAMGDQRAPADPDAAAADAAMNFMRNLSARGGTP